MRDARYEQLTDPECRKLLGERHLGLPLYPWAPGAKARFVRVEPTSITGRRIAIPANLPFTWWG